MSGVAGLGVPNGHVALILALKWILHATCAGQSSNGSSGSRLRGPNFSNHYELSMTAQQMPYNPFYIEYKNPITSVSAPRLHPLVFCSAKLKLSECRPRSPKWILVWLRSFSVRDMQDTLDELVEWDMFVG